MTMFRVLLAFKKKSRVSPVPPPKKNDAQSEELLVWLEAACNAVLLKSKVEGRHIFLYNTIIPRYWFSFFGWCIRRMRVRILGGDRPAS